jgi:hypothetical protein
MFTTSPRSRLLALRAGSPILRILRIVCRGETLPKRGSRERGQRLCPSLHAEGFQEALERQDERRSLTYDGKQRVLAAVDHSALALEEPTVDALDDQVKPCRLLDDDAFLLRDVRLAAEVRDQLASPEGERFPDLASAVDPRLPRTRSVRFRP